MGFQQISIFDFLSIVLLVIFMVTIAAVFLYWTWITIELVFRKTKKEPLRALEEGKIEGLLATTITAIELDSKHDSVSLEISYETDDGGEDVYFECHM